VAGDVSEAGAWQAAAAGADLLVHTAAIVSNAVGRREQWRVNVLGTRRALDAAHAGGVPRFVHFSSVRAFGDHGYPGGVTEQHPVRPHGSPYVDTKVASEQVVLQAHAAGEVAATVVRPADVYGPGSRPWTLLPLQAIRDGRFLLPAMGRGAFTPLYVDDLVAGVAAAAEDAGVGQVITLGPEEAVPAREFFAHYFRMLGRSGPRCAPTRVAVALAAAVSAASRLPTEVNPETMRYLARPGGYSVAKAARLLGWRAQVGLDEGMVRTERWLRAERLLP
jgi:nucleoside-diphosphate-sugar epimerase